MLSLQVQKRILGLGVLLYIAPLPLPAFSYQLAAGGRANMSGTLCLLLSIFFGWVGYLCCWANFTFFAWCLLTFMALRKQAVRDFASWRVALGLLSAIFAASFLLVDTLRRRHFKAIDSLDGR